jgi:anti-anti-sigma factor
MAVVSRSQWLSVEPIGDVTLVRFARRSILQDDEAQVLGGQLLGLAEDPSCRKFVINFADVEALSSTVVGKLFALHRRLVAAGGRLALCNVRPELLEVFEVLKLSRVLNLYDDEPQALQSF